MEYLINDNNDPEYVRVLATRKVVPEAVIDNLWRRISFDKDDYYRERIQAETRDSIVNRTDISRNQELLQQIEERAVAYTTCLLHNLDAAKELGHSWADLYLPIFPSEQDVVSGALAIVEAAMTELGYSPKREFGPLPHGTIDVQLGIAPPIFHRLSVRIFDL